MVASVGMNLKLARTRRRITGDQLAELSGISTVTIYSIENGHRSPRMSTLEKLAAAMDLTLSELTSDDQPAQPSPTEAQQNLSGQPTIRGQQPSTPSQDGPDMKPPASGDATNG